jgi:capsular polysaccharide biosynthesis protein
MREFIQIIKKGYWLIILTPIVAVTAMLVITKSETPTYQATTRLLINADKGALTGRDLIYTYAALDQAAIVATFVEIANSSRIFTNTVAALNLKDSALDSYTINAVSIPGASVLDISAHGPSPATVQQIANTAAQKMIEFVEQFYSGYTAEILDTATLPAVPVDPNPVRDASVAMVLGLVFGSMLAAAYYYLPQVRSSVRDEEIYDITSSAYTRSYLRKQLDVLGDDDVVNASLGIIKLDGLNLLNSVLSKSTYHRILHYAVNLMRDELRGKDIIARWGEDSFAIFTPDLPAAESERRLMAIFEKLERPQMVPAAGRLVYYDPQIRMIKNGGEERLYSMLQVAEAELVNTHPIDVNLRETQERRNAR